MTQKRIPLSFVNASEGIPRLIRAYGKCCDGECALVIRPLDNRAILVHHTRTGARVWNESVSEAPAKPSVDISPKESVALVRAYQQNLPKASPINLRGNWKGNLYCDDGVPRLEIERKIASYGTLVVTSVAGKGWKYRVEREEKWYSRAHETDGMASSLVAAIERGLTTAMGLLGEACSVRDSRRRAAYDSSYAEAHPIKPARDGKDPTERFNPKEPKPPIAKEGTKSPRAAGSPHSSTSHTTGLASPEVKGTGPTTSPNAGVKAIGSQPGHPPETAPTHNPSKRKNREPNEAHSKDIDPEKDALLLDAFTRAVSSALAGAKG